MKFNSYYLYCYVKIIFHVQNTNQYIHEINKIEFNFFLRIIISAMMAQMLSFIRNQSTYYNKVRRNIIVYPDENYARESK